MTRIHALVNEDDFITPLAYSGTYTEDEQQFLATNDFGILHKIASGDDDYQDLAYDIPEMSLGGYDCPMYIEFVMVKRNEI